MDWVEQHRWMSVYVCTFCCPWIDFTNHGLGTKQKILYGTIKLKCDHTFECINCSTWVITHYHLKNVTCSKYVFQNNNNGNNKKSIVQFSHKKNFPWSNQHFLYVFAFIEFTFRFVGKRIYTIKYWMRRMCYFALIFFVCIFYVR